jgi:hypothetical protein
LNVNKHTKYTHGSGCAFQTTKAMNTWTVDWHWRDETVALFPPRIVIRQLWIWRIGLRSVAQDQVWERERK